MEEDYVRQIEERSVHLVARTHAKIKVVQDLGGVSSSADGDTWRIDYDTENQLVSLLQTLRDCGLAFSGGSAGWPPAAVAEMLRDKGKLHGVIREATWLGPNQQVIEDR